MYIVLLKFSKNRANAPQFMTEHNEWIAKGFADGIFQCVGSITPNGGGALLAHGESRSEIEARIAADPFVAHDIVTAEITEVDVKRTAPALEFLKSA